jgi:hypothetical protein
MFSPLLIVATATAATTSPVSKSDIETNYCAPNAQTRNTLPKSRLTLDLFNKLFVGMTTKQLLNEIGCAGQIQTETLIGGTHQVMMAWKDSIGGQISVLIQNNRVVMRTQSGLE